MNFLHYGLNLSFSNPVFIEFNLLVIPLLLMLMKNEYFLQIFIIIVLIIFFLNFLHYYLKNEWLLSFANIYKTEHCKTINNQNYFEFVSKYRSLLQVTTCLTILAVDFQLFPRKFCKVEEEGVSLMDCGTGSALFSVALVSRQLREKNQNILRKLYRAISSCLPLLVIGLLRMYMIKQTDYQVSIFS